MTVDREKDRELAYRYDLFVGPDWGERLNVVLDEHVKLPTKGRLLEINCGTGTRALAVADRLEEGDVVGTEESAERVALARAKATAASSDRVTFIEADPENLQQLETGSFDGVVLDASLTAPNRLAAEVSEAVRVAGGGAPIAIKVMLRGSFDEFYSVFWEALHDLGIDSDVWARLERIITAHPTLAESLETARAAGVRDVTPHRSKEEWQFETGEAFLSSPVMGDLFLDEAFAIVPEDRRDEVRRVVATIVDRESSGTYFDVSAKTLVVAGAK
jgi:ubiquinone/menaquinone biosynthesis C-methylase UbiE